MTNSTPLEEAVERREQWLVEQLAGAWEWTEEMVRNALDKDCPRLNALSIDEPMELGAFLGKTLGEAARVSIDEERVAIPRELYAFLMGEAPMDDTWFGELNDGLPGAFWWRSLLKAGARDCQSIVGEGLRD